MLKCGKEVWWMSEERRLQQSSACKLYNGVIRRESFKPNAFRKFADVSV
jgi:hypothetical protein